MTMKEKPTMIVPTMAAVRDTAAGNTKPVGRGINHRRRGVVVIDHLIVIAKEKRGDVIVEIHLPAMTAAAIVVPIQITAVAAAPRHQDDVPNTVKKHTKNHPKSHPLTNKPSKAVYK